MIDLAQRSEPCEIALPCGLSVTVKRLTTAHRADGRSGRQAIERQVRRLTEAELASDGLPDRSAQGERDASYPAQLIRKLAMRHITI